MTRDTRIALFLMEELKAALRGNVLANTLSGKFGNNTLRGAYGDYVLIGNANTIYCAAASEMTPSSVAAMPITSSSQQATTSTTTSPSPMAIDS